MVPGSPVSVGREKAGAHSGPEPAPPGGGGSKTLRAWLRRTVVVSASAALFGTSAVSARAQRDTLSARIDGILLDEQMGTSVSQGVVRLLDQEGQIVVSVESDPLGRFSLRTPGPGTYRLQVSRIGYQTKESGEFSLPPRHVLTVEIRLVPSPLPLDSVEVVGRRRPLRSTEQLIQGTLLDHESGDAIPQGVVSLSKAFRTEGGGAELVEEVLSDDWGRFSFITPLPGTYRLKGERIGYRTSESSNLHMMPGDTVVLDLYMSVEAIVLDPISVRASARPWSDRYPLLGMESFFHRQSRFGESGSGAFLTRDSLAAFEGRMETSRMLLISVSSVRALNDGGGVILPHGCNPRYYVNDMEVVRGDPVHEPMMGADPSTPLSQGLDLERMFPPETLEAVEVYVSPTIPAEFSNGYPCGVIAFWTRRR